MTPIAMSFAAARGLPAFAAAKSAAKSVNTHNPAEIPGALFRNRFMANLHVLLLFGCLPRSDHWEYLHIPFLSVEYGVLSGGMPGKLNPSAWFAQPCRRDLACSKQDTKVGSDTG